MEVIKMVQVTRKWIKENVELFSAFGNQITLENFEEYLRGVKTIQTTLSKAGKDGVENKALPNKFHILIPGNGWADCYGYDGNKWDVEEDDLHHNDNELDF